MSLPPPVPPPLRPVVPETRTNGMAVASLCCALASFTTGITWILGIVFGHVALGQIRRDPTQTGRGLAIAGLTVGYAFIALFVLGVVLLVTVD